MRLIGRANDGNDDCLQLDSITYGCVFLTNKEQGSGTFRSVSYILFALSSSLTCFKKNGCTRGRSHFRPTRIHHVDQLTFIMLVVRPSTEVF